VPKAASIPGDSSDVIAPFMPSSRKLARQAASGGRRACTLPAERDTFSGEGVISASTFHAGTFGAQC